ncbi:hypothetical protein MRX96_000025 [Rhipicephalus microplus]
MLGAYNYKLMYRPEASIANADGLSRLPLPGYAQPVERPAEVFMLEAAYPRVLRSTVVAEATSKDSTLAKLREAVWSGAELRDPEFRFYADRKLQMSVQEDSILLGSRVVIPSALQQEVLRLLHEGHPGMTKMKAIARSHVWRSSLDEDITAAVRQCQICQEHQRVARPTVGVGGAIKNTCGRTSPQLVRLLDCRLSDRLLHRRQCYRLCNKLRQPRIVRF